MIDQEAEIENIKIKKIKQNNSINLLTTFKKVKNKLQK